MKKNVRRYLVLFFLGFFLACFSTYAISQSLTVTRDGDFQTADAQGSSGYNTMGTNRVISYAPGFSGPAKGREGRVRLSGVSKGTSLRINCRSEDFSFPQQAKLNNPAAGGGLSQIILDNVTFAFGNKNKAGPGVGNICGGLWSGSDIITTYPGGGGNKRTVYLGGRLDVSGGVKTTGTYSSTNAGGSGITVQVWFDSPYWTTQEATVDWDAEFTSSLSITASIDMDFGLVDYATLGGSQANMGTNGGIGYVGSFSGSGSGTPASVTIGGISNGTMLDVYCDDTATLTRTGGGSIQVTNIEGMLEGFTGAFGAGVGCTGAMAGSPIGSFSYDNPTRDTLFFGGRLDGNTASGFVSGSYSTGNTGGSPFLVNVVIQ